MPLYCPHPDRVTRVLLHDGWHAVKLGTFRTDVIGATFVRAVATYTGTAGAVIAGRVVHVHRDDVHAVEHIAEHEHAARADHPTGATLDVLT
jgi:hypothetical protein